MLKTSCATGSLLTLATLTALGGCVADLGVEPLSRSARDDGRDGVVALDDGAGDADDVGDDGVDVVDDAPATLPPWDSSGLFREVRDGRIAGRMGPLSDLDLPSDIATVDDHGFFTDVSVYAVRGDGRRVLLALQVQSADGTPFFVPGVGKRLVPGYSRTATIASMGCEGPDSGDASDPFDDTPYDEEPCDVSVDTEQDPESPQVLLVHVQANFPDGDGNCGNDPPGGDGDGFGEEDLPDLDGDGDGDLPAGCGGDGPGEEPGNGVQPLATATFSLAR